MLFFVGAITSYEDFRFGKIRNRWIILGLCWGLGIFALLFLWRMLASPLTRYYYFHILQLPADSSVLVVTANLDFLLKTLWNFAISALAGFLLWRFDAWAPGDGKLFIVSSLLIPLFYYERSYFDFFPSFVLLLNIFCIFLFYLLLGSGYYWFKSFWPDLRSGKIGINFPELADLKKLKDLAKTVIFSLAIIFLFSIAQAQIKILLGWDVQFLQPFVFGLLVIFSGFIQKLISRRWFVWLAAAVLIFALAFQFKIDLAAGRTFLWQSVKIMLAFMLFFGLFQKLINYYTARTQTEEIAVEKLTKGMILTSDVAKELGMFLGKGEQERLSVEQVESVKKSCAEKKWQTVKLIKACPFAGWIFVGAVATLFLKGSILTVLMKWAGL